MTNLNKSDKKYIDALKIEAVPWQRMLTVYGTARRFASALSLVCRSLNYDEVLKEVQYITDETEHQDTLYQPSPFVAAFFARRTDELLAANSPQADKIAEMLLSFLCLIAEDCVNRCENTEIWVFECFDNFSDFLRDKYLLPEEYTEAETDELSDVQLDDIIWEDSLYCYSLKIIAEIPTLLDGYGKFPELSKKIKESCSLISCISESE